VSNTRTITLVALSRDPDLMVVSPVRPQLSATLRGAILLYSHAGSSMNPTLHELDVLEIIPYGNTPVQVGDVILFTAPGRNLCVVHRVVSATTAGIRTRGDNSTGNDRWVLGPMDISGRVVAAWRGRKRRGVAGGRAGWLWAYWLHIRSVLHRPLGFFTRLLYCPIARWGRLGSLLPRHFKPRAVVFQTRGCTRMWLLMGRHVVGRYDDSQKSWQIKPPFRLFVREAVLPRGPTGFGAKRV
jgi:hypothetical protein